MPETVGRYRILRPLGRGAMGLVYLAEDPSLNRQVAIKMLDVLADSAGDREFLHDRLMRDAKAAAILSHPNIVSVFDIVEDGDSVYVVMEYIEGESLATYLDSTPVPDHAFTVRALQQVAAGLDYTHSRGIIHRDIKPGNIMIGASGIVKILDFGIARMADVRTSTPTGMVMGTVDYMAPEQIKAAMIDGRADQFSLAAVAYRMISGSTLFGRHTLATLTYKLVNESPQPVCEQNAALPAAVDQVLMKALAKSPTDRYGTCSSFVDALAQAFSGGPAALPPTATMAVQGQDVAPTGKRSKSVPLAVAGIAGVLLAGGGIAVWKPWNKSATTVPVAAVPQPVEKAPAEAPPVISTPVPEVKPAVVPAPVAAAKPKETTVKKSEPPAKTAPPPPPVPVKEAEVAMSTPDALPSPVPPTSPAAKETIFHKGQEAMQVRDYPEAIRDFSKAIELHPKMVHAYAGRGLAFQSSNQPVKAVQDYSDAIRLGSQDAHVYTNRGVCEVKLHEDDLALGDFNRALDIEKGFPAALNGRGGIYYRRHQYKMAVDDFNAAIRGNAKFLPAYENRYNARKALGDLAGAADDYVVIQRLKQKR